MHLSSGMLVKTLDKKLYCLLFVLIQSRMSSSAIIIFCCGFISLLIFLSFAVVVVVVVVVVSSTLLFNFDDVSLFKVSLFLCLITV